MAMANCEDGYSLLINLSLFSVSRFGLLHVFLDILLKSISQNHFAQFDILHILNMLETTYQQNRNLIYAALQSND